MGWKPVLQAGEMQGLLDVNDQKTGRLSSEILMMFLGCTGVYSLLFGMGFVLYGQSLNAVISLGVAIFSGLVMRKLWVSIS